MKRSFVEYVTAKKFRNMAREMFLKAALYNLQTKMTASSLLEDSILVLKPWLYLFFEDLDSHPGGCAELIPYDGV